MTTIEIAKNHLRLSFSTFEKVAGLLRDTEIPLSAVRGVEVVPDGIAATKGLRAPGLGVPWVRLVGTWRGRGVKSIVSVRRGRPAVRLHLNRHAYDTVLVGVDDAMTTARDVEAAVRRASSGGDGPDR